MRDSETQLLVCWRVTVALTVIDGQWIGTGHGAVDCVGWEDDMADRFHDVGNGMFPMLGWSQR
jgi:hypothetical protein